MNFSKIKTILGLQKDAKINTESDKRKEIYADKTAYLLSRPECFGDKWFELDDGDKNSIVEMLIDDSLEDDVLIQKAEKKSIIRQLQYSI